MDRYKQPLVSLGSETKTNQKNSPFLETPISLYKDLLSLFLSNTFVTLLSAQGLLDLVI